MNTQELTYRFDEIMTAISLVDEKADMDTYQLPNGTLGLSNPALYSAILCEIMKHDDDFKMRACGTFTATAVRQVSTNHKASEDDLTALAITANICWEAGAGKSLFSTLGLLATIADQSEADLPSLSFSFLRSNRGAAKFGALDPYKILSGAVTDSDIAQLAQD